MRRARPLNPPMQFIIISVDIRCPPFETNANETKLTEQFPFSRILECPEGLTFRNGLRIRLLECVRPHKWNTDDVMCQRKNRTVDIKLSGQEILIRFMTIVSMLWEPMLCFCGIKKKEVLLVRNL